MTLGWFLREDGFIDLMVRTELIPGHSREGFGKLQHPASLLAESCLCILSPVPTLHLNETEQPVLMSENLGKLPS